MGRSPLVVVPYSTHEATGDELRIADQIEAALSSARVPVISMHDARDRMLARSRAPVDVKKSDLDELERAAREAIEHAVFGRSAATQRSVTRLIERAERALESLNRETKTAQIVLDACLALVRSALTRGERHAALVDAMRCRRLVPDVSASESLHPASVIGVLAEADDQLRRMRQGRLSVESTPTSGCHVYVNGRQLGVTPFRIERATAGEYRVQVECERAPGRVHFVQLGDEPTSLRVDTEFDGALRSEGRISLVYEQVPAVPRLVDHAAQLSRDVGAEEVVLFRMQESTLQLIRVGLHAQQLGRVNLHGCVSQTDDPCPNADLTTALDRLLEGNFEQDQRGDRPAVSNTVDDFSNSRPSELRTEVQSAPPPSTDAMNETSSSKEKGSRGRIAFLGTTVGLGIASLVTAGVLSHQRGERGQAVIEAIPGTSDYHKAVAAWNSRRTAPYLFAAAGGVLTAAGLVGLAVVGERPPPRAVSIASGAIALGFLSWSIADIIGGGPCSPELDIRGCVPERDRRDRGGLVALAALPFLALPIAHGLRAVLESKGLQDPALAWEASARREVAELRLRFSARY